MKTRYFKNLIIIFTLTIAITMAFSACQKNQPADTNTQLPTNQETVATTNGVDTSGWKTYRNEEYGFQLKYPEDWEFDKKNAFIDNPKSYGIFLYNNKESVKLFIFPVGEFDRGIKAEISNEEVLIDEKKFVKKNYNGFFINSMIDSDFRMEGYYTNDQEKLLLNVIVGTFVFFD